VPAAARARLALVALLVPRDLMAAPVKVAAEAKQALAVLAAARARLALVVLPVPRDLVAAPDGVGAEAREARSVPAAARVLVALAVPLVPVVRAVWRALAVRAAFGARSATPAPGTPRSRPRRRSIPTARP